MEKNNTHTKNILKRNLTILAAFAVLCIIHFIPVPQWLPSSSFGREIVLTPGGKTALGVLIFALILWVTEAIPFHITGLLSMFFLALLGVAEFAEVVRLGFGSHIVIFMIGVLTLSSFVHISGLGRRITLFLLSSTGNKTERIIFGFLSIGALLSMWLSNMAVAAMLMPLAKGILEDEGIQPLKSNFGKSLMIACAWGPAIGGVGTPAGAGPNPLAIGFLKEMAGIDISFLQWMAFGLPAVILLLIPSWFVLIKVFPAEIKTLRLGSEDLKKSYRDLAPMDREEKITVSIFLLTVLLWLTAPIFEGLLKVDVPISMTVMFTAGLFFLPGFTKIPWKKVEKEMDWGSVILVLAGISLGMTLHTTGAAQWLSTLLLGGIGGFHVFIRILVVVLIVSALKVVFCSNSVTATIVVPIMIALAQTIEVNVLLLALPAALTSSLGLILVTSAPTNVIPYGAGYFSIGDMAKSGVLLTVLAVPLVSFVIYIVAALMGGSV